MLKTIGSFLIRQVLLFLLRLRYRIQVVGLEKIVNHKFERRGGILFLANHPAEIDPCILMAILWPNFQPHPVAIESLFHKPLVRFFLEWTGALPVPNFEGSSNSFKKKQIEKTYERLFALLRNKGNLLIYPGAGLKSQGEELIGGASGAHHILSSCPEANVVLVKTVGLWGSSFSRAFTGKTPAVGPAFRHALSAILKNLIFFVPKRDITIELGLPESAFPREGSKRELNAYLEEWYNRGGPEPLKLVSYSFWKEDLPPLLKQGEREKKGGGAIPSEIEEAVKNEIAHRVGMPVSEIRLEHDLARDLGIDSLDQAELTLFLKENYGINQILSSELVTVEDVCLFAARLKTGERAEEESHFEHRKWAGEKGRPPPKPPEGATIGEAFLRTADRMGNALACADLISGEVTYKRLKTVVFLLAEEIKKLPGERVGILLPATVAVNALLLATLLARKVPVMINWTLGIRNLKSVVEQSQVESVLSSWSFLDKLENVDLNGLDEKIILLENVRRGFTLKAKLLATWQANQSVESLMQHFGLHEVQGDDPAVILFTSGTENVPKGVPLSHTNILANQRDAFAMAQVNEHDILLGVLPPFHSFGFSVAGLLPLLGGIRVAYSPNPTDGKKLAAAIDEWKATLFFIAPTFLKNIFRVATQEQLRSLRLVVTGAEKTSPEMYETLRSLNPKAQLLEGYGITECAPILTLNPPDVKPCGVGLPLPHVTLKIVHPETGEEMPQGKEGLILAHGPNIFAGYLDPHLKSPFRSIHGANWYVTGDLGFLDEKGFLTLSGRLKRFVKIGGEMVSLNAIEEVLLEVGPSKGWKIDPEVPSLAVSAIEEGGKKGEIILFTTFPTRADEANTILKASGMSNLIRISSVHQVSFIPLLGAGKIDYRTLSSKMQE